MRRLVLSLVLMLACASPAWTQVVSDGEVRQSVVTSSTTTHTITNQTTAGSNRVGTLRCVVSSPGLVTGATWNGVPITELVQATNGTDGRGVIIYWIPAPPTAASSVVLTTSAPADALCMAGGYTGAHQTVQTGDTSVASGTADPATVDCTSGTNELIVDALYFVGAGTAPAEGADQTDELTTDNGNYFASFSRQPDSAGDTMSWTLTSPTRWTQACVALQPVSGGPAAAPTGLLLGVGGER